MLYCSHIEINADSRNEDVNDSHFPRLKATIKDFPFLILAALIARLVKDLLLTPFGLYFNYLTDEFDLGKFLLNWGLLTFFFFAIIYLRNRIRKKREQ